MLIKEPDPELILSLAASLLLTSFVPCILWAVEVETVGMDTGAPNPHCSLPTAAPCQHSLARSVFMPQCWGMVSRVGRARGSFLPGQPWASLAE